MGKDHLRMDEVSIASLRKLMPQAIGIDNELLLFDDLSKMPWPKEPRRMRCILLGLCLHGRAQYSVNTEEHMIRPNDVIVINDDTVIDNYMLTNDFNGLAIVMSHEFFREIIKGIHELSQIFLFSRTHPVINLTSDEVFIIRAYFRAIKFRAADTSHHFRTDVVRSLMATLVYDFSNAIYRLQQTGDRRRTRAESIFASFIKSVEEHFREERRVSWYAQQLDISPKYLSESVKTVSHRTPSEWIDNYVTLEARVLLKNSPLSVKDIAKALHFPNQSFLGKYFKEHVGMSPSEYRHH